MINDSIHIVFTVTDDPTTYRAIKYTKLTNISVAILTVTAEESVAYFNVTTNLILGVAFTQDDISNMLYIGYSILNDSSLYKIFIQKKVSGGTFDNSNNIEIMSSSDMILLKNIVYDNINDYIMFIIDFEVYKAIYSISYQCFGAGSSAFYLEKNRTILIFRDSSGACFTNYDSVRGLLYIIFSHENKIKLCIYEQTNINMSLIDTRDLYTGITILLTVGFCIYDDFYILQHPEYIYCITVDDRDLIFAYAEQSGAIGETIYGSPVGSNSNIFAPYNVNYIGKILYIDKDLYPTLDKNDYPIGTIVSTTELLRK